MKYYVEVEYSFETPYSEEEISSMGIFYAEEIRNGLFGTTFIPNFINACIKKVEVKDALDIFGENTLYDLFEKYRQNGVNIEDYTEGELEEHLEDFLTYELDYALKEEQDVDLLEKFLSHYGYVLDTVRDWHNGSKIPVIYKESVKRGFVESVWNGTGFFSYTIYDEFMRIVDSMNNVYHDVIDESTITSEIRSMIGNDFVKEEIALVKTYLIEDIEVNDYDIVVPIPETYTFKKVN